ncbi:MAG: FmdB family transcriptional regulator [Thermodesulfovibrio sp. RBG_19FT_COMBO_42_12]|nr:MAG: FmdB family transcriptional regulator [Thermodesulfovibrio sp. RBG_19FT_COMBO_42_12]
MPIYEYRCSKCGYSFDVIQKVNDPPITTCTKCSGPINKVISSAGLVFKGSGWYITDYSSKGKREEKSPGKKEDKKDAPKTTT